MENNVVCNGRSTLSKPAKSTDAQGITTNKHADLAFRANLNWLIHIAFARQDYKYCKEVIEYQFRETFDHEYLYYIKGLIARIEGELHESLQHLQKAIEFNPNNLDNLKEIAKTLYSMERYNQALDAFLKIEKMAPNGDQEVFYYIGDLLHKQCSKKQIPVTDEVKDYFHRATSDSKHIESFNRLAEIYKAENNFPKAIEVLESTAQITTENVDVLMEIGILYLRINDNKKAFDKLFEVSKIFDNCSKALLALGSILQSRNDVDGALNKYKLIEAESQKSAEIWNNVGLCFYKKRKFIAAISCLKKAIWLEPTNFNCLFNLGLIYLMAQQYASAFHALAAAACIRLDSVECYMLLGICLRNLNDHGNAYLAFERAVTLADAVKSPLAHLNFAIYCWHLKRYDLAQANLNNFYTVISQVSVRNEHKSAGERLKALLSKLISPTINQVAQIESTGEPAEGNGAGEAMATLAENEDLV